jgi:hypothetical protein
MASILLGLLSEALIWRLELLRLLIIGRPKALLWVTSRHRSLIFRTYKPARSLTNLTNEAVDSECSTQHKDSP